MMSGDKETETLDLAALIGFEKLQRLLQRVHDVTGFAVGCMDAQGRLLCKAGNTEPFCMKLVRQSPLGLARCNQFASAYDDRGEKAANVYQCHTGLLDGRIPIVASGKPIGFLVTGQVLEKIPEKKSRQRSMHLSLVLTLRSTGRKYKKLRK